MMLKAAEYIEPERKRPYLHGALTVAVVVPACLLWSLIVAAVFMGGDAPDPAAPSALIYGP